MYSTEEKKAILEKIQAYRDSGLNRVDAVKKGGISGATYVDWKKKFQGNVVVHEAQSLKRAYKKLKTTEENVVLVVAKASQLRSVLEALR